MSARRFAGHRPDDRCAVTVCTPRGRRSGFTLLEMVMSLAVTSIIIIAMGSAVVLASRALPSADSTQLLEVDRAFADFSDQLRTAIDITQRSPNAITFTVADRTGDGLPETIRYAWSGSAGDPLVRRINGGADVIVLKDLKQFALTFDTQTEVESFPGTQADSGEIELASHDSPLPGAAYNISSNNWIGQYFPRICRLRRLAGMCLG